MVVDLAILIGTQGGRSLIEFLDFLQLPEVPPTEDVVAHFEHCMAENLPASDVVYAILSERLGAEVAGRLDRQEGEAFIYEVGSTEGRGSVCPNAEVLEVALKIEKKTQRE